MPASKRLRRLVLLVFLAVFSVSSLVWVFAPQVPVLVAEGFPDPRWPARGEFAVVAGGGGAMPDAAGDVLPDAAAALFAETGGAALLMERGGVLEYEVYADGVDRSTRFNSFSMVKTLVGAMTLRAIADGRIEGLDARLPSYLGPSAPDLSMGDLLTMTGGLRATPQADKSGRDESYGLFTTLARAHVFGPERAMSQVWVDEVTQGRFAYQSMNTALLGQVLETVYGESLADLLSRWIWHPAGAAEAYWRQYPMGPGVTSYCCLYARAADWVAVGRFLLNNGIPGNPFLPNDLWAALILPDLAPDDRRAGVYGLHIRHDVLDRAGAAVQGPFAYLMGHGGQVMYLVPGEDGVVVRFGESPQLLHSTLYQLLGE